MLYSTIGLQGDFCTRNITELIKPCKAHVTSCFELFATLFIVRTIQMRLMGNVLSSTPKRIRSK